MMMPKTISGWAMWLFFLLYGVFAFWSFGYAAWILGILALVYAIAALFGR
jgi:hypothetical protein